MYDIHFIYSLIVGTVLNLFVARIRIIKAPVIPMFITVSTLSVWFLFNLIIDIIYGEYGSLQIGANDQYAYYNDVKSIIADPSINNLLSTLRPFVTILGALFSWIIFIHPILSLKLLNIICYLLSLRYLLLLKNKFILKGRYLLFTFLVAGPSILSFTLQGNREGPLILFTTLYFGTIISNGFKNKTLLFVLLLILTGLRPHLAVCLAAATLIVYITNVGNKLYILKPIYYTLSVALGMLLFLFGAYILNWNQGINELYNAIPDIFIFPLQYMTGTAFIFADDSLLRISRLNLSLLRIFFFDSLLVPIISTIIILFHKGRIFDIVSKNHNRAIILYFISFISYSVIVYTPQFFSYRQSVHFFPISGYIIYYIYWVRIRKYRQ